MKSNSSCSAIAHGQMACHLTRLVLHSQLLPANHARPSVARLLSAAAHLQIIAHSISPSSEYGGGFRPDTDAAYGTSKAQLIRSSCTALQTSTEEEGESHIWPAKATDACCAVIQSYFRLARTWSYDLARPNLSLSFALAVQLTVYMPKATDITRTPLTSCRHFQAADQEKVKQQSVLWRHVCRPDDPSFNILV